MTWTVYSSLRESILNGALPPGESLSQVQLATKLGVSRGPLREAVRMLQREGLVEAEVNRRGRVSSFSMDDLEQLYAMRIVHESLAIRITVPRFTQKDIDALHKLPAPHGVARGPRSAPVAGRRPRISFHAGRARRRSPHAHHPRVCTTTPIDTAGSTSKVSLERSRLQPRNTSASSKPARPVMPRLPPASSRATLRARR